MRRPKLLLLMLSFLLMAVTGARAGDVLVNEANFPDALFRTCISNVEDSSNGKKLAEDGVLTDEEIAKVKGIMFEHLGVQSIKGIEFLTSLETLYGSSNYLTEVDLSQNTKLKIVSLANNNLTSLDLSNNPDVTHLGCYGNPLTSLDLTINTKLVSLSCGDTQLTSLDVSNHKALVDVYCANAQLSSLNVSGCTKLYYISCQQNQLTSLDISGATALEALECYQNPLTELDVSMSNTLRNLTCNDCQMTKLTVSGANQLLTLFCHNNLLKTLDVSGCPSLYDLQCYNNPLTTLDLSHNYALHSLDCHSMQLTSLDLSHNPEIKNLDCYLNGIYGSAMDALVAGLPTHNNIQHGYINVFYNVGEGNVITTTQVNVATGKYWYVQRYTGKYWTDYDGLDPTAPVPVTKVELDADTRMVCVDDVVALTATVTPTIATNSKVLWTTNNSNVKLYSNPSLTEAVSSTVPTDVHFVYIKGVSKGTTTVTVTSDDNPSIQATCEVTVNQPMKILREDEDNSAWIAAHKGETWTVQLIRTVKGGYWNTFAVPFEVDHDQMISLFGTGGYVMGLRQSSYADGNLTLNCGSVYKILAGTAYLVKTEYNLVNPIFYNVVISDQIYSDYVSSAYVDLIPTFGKTQVGSPGDDPKRILYLGSGNKLYKPSSLPAAMLGFRGYFKVKSTTAEVSSFNLDFDDDMTGISLQLTEDGKRSDTDVYNLSGQRVARPNKGLYIVNGKKVVIK